MTNPCKVGQLVNVIIERNTDDRPDCLRWEMEYSGRVTEVLGDKLVKLDGGSTVQVVSDKRADVELDIIGSAARPDRVGWYEGLLREGFPSVRWWDGTGWSFHPGQQPGIALPLARNLHYLGKGAAE